MTDSGTHTTDASHGHSLIARVEARRRELQIAAARLEPGNHSRQDIDAALAAVAGMLTGDLDHIPSMVSADLSLWLERNKYLGEHHEAPPTSTAPVAKGAPADGATLAEPSVEEKAAP
jgi:hypothetical protein